MIATESSGERTGPATHLKRKSNLDNLHLKKFITFADGYDMPVLKPCEIIPMGLIPFNEIKTCKSNSQCVHFFIDDYQFERIWNQPGRYIECLKQFQCVISPDFSQYIDMPFAHRMWNNYRGKFIGAWLQSQGVNIMPNVTWSLPDSYDYSFEGIPQKSVIAINSTGVARYGFSRYLWLKGYQEAISRLNPIAIIRYGNVIKGEDKSLGIYFNNERLIKLRANGR